MKDESTDMILVTGIPRSGTSWISKVLCYSNQVKGYYEPDNEHNSLLGYIYKQDLHRFPYLKSGDSKSGLYTIFKKTISDNYLHDYSKPSLAIKKLFNINLAKSELEVKKKCKIRQEDKKRIGILAIKQRMRLKMAEMLYSFSQFFKRYNKYNKMPLIKSVHCLLALPYIQSFFKAKIIVILRHPASIVASHLRLKNQDIDRNIMNQKGLNGDYLYPFIDKINALEDPLEKAGAQVAAFYYVLARQIKENPDWIIVKHEDVCLNSRQEFKKLYDRLNLDWSNEIYDKIGALNKQGEGYTTNRISRREINKWNKELEPSQIDKIKRGYGIITPSFYKDFIHHNVSS